jgi:hypothetical protein
MGEGTSDGDGQQPPTPAAPGEPGGGGDEFAGIEPAPRRRSPIAALVVVALAALLTWHLRADLRYALSSRAAAELGDARSLAERTVTLDDNRYVTLHGQPDRRNALFIEPRGEKTRQAFFRLLGTGTRVLVRAADTAGRADLKDEWTGRLRRFDTLPWAPSLRGYYADKVQAMRYLAPETLKAAVAKGAGGALRDRAGEPIELTAATPISVDVSFPEHLVVTMPAEKFPTDADARHELERMGLSVVPQPTATKKEDGQELFELLIKAPLAERNKILAKLEEKAIPFAAYEDRWSARLAELKDGGDTLSVGERAVPWAQVRSAGVEAPIAIADDAFVLTEGEAPGGYWWAPALVLVLLGFAAFNVWYLLRARRA